MQIAELRTRLRPFLGVPLIAFALAACDDVYGSDPDDEEPLPLATVVTATGDITAKVAEFRTLLGEPANGGTPGEQAGGRREISWDGAGANPFNNRNDFPADFFKNVGAVFVTDGTGFRNDSTLFGDLDATYPLQFNFFSSNRTFAPVGSPRMDVFFRVAGDTIQAAVNGFGVVFADVDKANVATIQPYDRNGRSLGIYSAPIRSDASGLSFVGFKFDSAIVARVRITSGEASVTAGLKDVSSGGAADLIVMDNFLFGEPHK